MKYKFNCEICNKEFFRKQNKGKFCSKECRYPNHNKIVKKDCENCGKQFSFEYKESYEKKFCSKDCTYKGRRNSLKKNPPITKTCLWCEKEFELPYHRRKHKNTCSRSCASAMGNSKFDKDAANKKSSETRKMMYENGEIVPSFLGKTHSKETREKISKKAKERFKDPTNNPMYGKNHSEKSKEQISKSWAKKFVDGYHHPNKAGRKFYSKINKELFFRSSWEERAMDMLNVDLEVKLFEYEPFAIPYLKQEGNRAHKRNYIPDLLVRYVDGTKKLIEVKPDCYLDAQVNIAKFKAAREYCKKNNMTFEVWSKKELGL